MSERTSRFLAIALCLSVALHLATYLWLIFGPSRTHPAPRGVVSVDFIEPFAHPPERAEAAKPKAKPDHPSTKALPERVAAAPTTLPNTAVEPNVPGEPNTVVAPVDAAAVGRETSIFTNAVARLINRNKIYPKEAIDREEEGRVLVGLTLDRAGKALQTTIEEPSPFGRLNEAALQTVRGLGQFPPIPEMVPAPLHLHIPILFQIQHN